MNMYQDVNVVTLSRQSQNPVIALPIRLNDMYRKTLFPMHMDADMHRKCHIPVHIQYDKPERVSSLPIQQAAIFNKIEGQ